MEKKNISKVIISVIAVAVVIAIVGGATFAYWQWQTADEQQTLVNVTVAEGITMTINPTTVNENDLRPTNSCANGYALMGTATVSIDNQTGVQAKPTFMLKFKSSKALSTAAWSKINFAITESNGDCTDPLYQGTFSTGATTANEWADTDEIPRENVTFTAPPYNGGTKAQLGTPTTHVYDVYVWVDSSYVGTVNTGTTVADPLQNNTLTVTWSGNSYVTQVFE